MKKKPILLFLIITGTMSCIFAGSFCVSADTCVEHTSIGFSYNHGHMDYEIKVSTGFPNTALIMKQQDNWEFKYNTTVSPGGPLFFDALRFYNGLEFTPRYVLVDSASFKLGAGISVFCEYYNGYRIRSDFKTTNIGFKASVKPEVILFEHFSVFGNLDIPMCQIAVSENRNVSLSSLLTDSSIWEKIKYRASIGLGYSWGGN